MVTDVILEYIGKTLELLYNLLNHQGITRVIGASPFWILVAFFASSAMIAIACRLSVSLFAERSGGS